MAETPSIDPQIYARWRATPLGATTERLEIDLVFDLAGSVSGQTVLDVARGMERTLSKLPSEEPG